jgi:hypothetical protein
MTGQGLQNLYSEFSVAGGPIGVVAPAFDSWHQTFWDNLVISLDLHQIDRVVALTHRDCGAAKAAYGEQMATDRDYETAMHTQALQSLRAEVLARHPELAVDLGIMDLEGCPTHHVGRGHVEMSHTWAPRRRRSAAVATMLPPRLRQARRAVQSVSVRTVPP